MFDRRKVLTGLAGGAAALATPGLPWLALGQQRPSLVSGLPSGGIRHRRPRRAAGKEAADQTVLPATQLRDPSLVLQNRDHAEDLYEWEWEVCRENTSAQLRCIPVTRRLVTGMLGI